MKVIGRAIGILTNSVTGEKTVAFDQSNHVQDRLLKGLCSWWDSGSSIANTLFIGWGGHSPITQRRDWSSLPADTTYGVNITGVTSPTYIYDEPIDSVHVKELAQRFTAPATVDRTIYVIGIKSTLVDTAVTLTVPCIQTTLQTLDVFYRVQVPFDPFYWDTVPSPTSIDPTPYELREWMQYVVGGERIPVDGTTQGANWADKINPRFLKEYKSLAMNSVLLTAADTNADSDYFRVGQSYTLPIANSIGKFIGFNFFSDSSTVVMHGQHVLKDQVNPTPVQNIFGHSAASAVPFYDAGNSQTGLGTMIIDGSAWTNPDYPKHVELAVTTTGGLGVGTYQFKIRNCFGYNLNTYENKVQECIGYHYSNKHSTDGFSITRGNPEIISDINETRKTAIVERLDDRTIVAGWIDDVMISDVPSQSATRFAADTTPAMSAVNITQFHSDPSTGDVYVACRTNGAFRISADKTTVTRFYSATPGLSGVSGCYGINVTATGRVWAYFGGGATIFGLYYSDDSGATWTKPTFSHATIDATPTRVVQVIVDPSNADDHVAVLYGTDIVTNTRDLMIAWWDLAGVVAVLGVAVQGPMATQVVDYEGLFNLAQQPNPSLWIDYSVPISLNKCLRCSPNDGFWISPHRRTTGSSNFGYFTKFVFGDATVTPIASTDLKAYNCTGGGWGVDEAGGDAFFYISYKTQTDFLSWSLNTAPVVMVRPDMSYDLASFQLIDTSIEFSEASICYMGNGVYLAVEPASWSTGVAPAASAGAVGIISCVPDDPTENTSVGDSVFDNEFNPTYGWDGLNWVKGNAGSKAMHAASELLIDGVNISFDDAAGANDWVATDFYTVILFNGIVADGSTTYSQDLMVYMKPTTHSTDLESGTLPATTRVPGDFQEFIPTIGDWQDVVACSISLDQVMRTVSGTYGAWNSTARTVAPAISGSISNLSSVSRLPANDLIGVQGYVEWNFYVSTDITSNAQQHAAGLSNSSHLGGPLNNTTIQYGIQIDTGPTSTSDNITYTVIESGVVKAIIADLKVSNLYANRARITVKTDGGVIYELYDMNKGWIQLHESPPATAIIEDLHLEYTSSIHSNGIRDIKTYSHFPDDHHLFFGNGVDSGVFTTKFRAVDPLSVKLLIGGIEALQVAVNDDTTALSTGEYSVFPKSGTIRYSASDVGKTISGNYITIRDEA